MFNVSNLYWYDHIRTDVDDDVSSCVFCQIRVVFPTTADRVLVTSCGGITTRRLVNVTSSSTADVKETTTDSRPNSNAGQRATLSRHKAKQFYPNSSRF